MLTAALILIAFVSLFFLHPVAFRSVMIVLGIVVYAGFWLAVLVVLGLIVGWVFLGVI